jgi:hypothetical protein
MTILPGKAIDRFFQTEVEGVTELLNGLLTSVTVRNKNLSEPWDFQGQKRPWKPLGPNYMQLCDWKVTYLDDLLRNNMFCDNENLTKLPALTVGPMWTTLWELAIRYQYLPVWYPQF